MAVLAALRSKRKKTIPTIQPKKLPIAGENVAVANCSPMKRSMSSLRSSSTEAIDDGSDKCRVFPSTDGNDNIAQPSSAVPTTTSIATGMIALIDSRATLGCSMVEPLSSFITPVTLAIDSAPESARMTPTNWTQTFLARLKEMRRQVRRANADQNDDYDQRWHREGDSETAGMFWAEIIDRAHDQEHRDGGERDVIAEKLDPGDVFGA